MLWIFGATERFGAVGDTYKARFETLVMKFSKVWKIPGPVVLAKAAFKYATGDHLICCFFLSVELRGSRWPSSKLLSPDFQPPPLFLRSPGRQQSWCWGKLLSQKPRCTAKGRHLEIGLNLGWTLPFLSSVALSSKWWGSKAEIKDILDGNKCPWKGLKWMYRCKLGDTPRSHFLESPQKSQWLKFPCCVCETTWRTNQFQRS